ncbi:GTP-binding protein TypA/BipA-like protein [Bienertia sinuspersici]
MTRHLMNDTVISLEEAIGYVQSDELIEVTPKAIRLRKKYLDVNKRKTMSKRPKEEIGLGRSFYRSRARNNKLKDSTSLVARVSFIPGLAQLVSQV